MLGVTKQAVMKTSWWKNNRKGDKEAEIPLGDSINTVSDLGSASQRNSMMKTDELFGVGEHRRVTQATFAGFKYRES